MSETHEEGLSALLHETRTFVPPADLAKKANAQPGIYAEADADPIGFWEAQARELAWAQALVDGARVGPPLRQVVRRRHPQRRRQLRRPPRRGRPGRPGGLPLGGRAGRHPDHHLRRPVGFGLPGGQRAERARRAGRRQGGHLPADDPRGRRGHAGLRPAGGAAHRGLRRLLGRRAAQPHPRLRRPLRDHRRRRLSARRARARSSRRSTRRWPSARRWRRCSWSGARARTWPGTRAATSGGTTWSSASPSRTRPRPSTPSSRSTSCTPAARRPSPRASCTPAAAT